MKPKPQKSRAVARTRRHRDGTAQTGGGGKPPAPRARWLPKWAAVLLVVALVAGGAFAVFEFILPSRIPRELVGEWRVVGGELSGATFEFRRDGSMTSTFRTGDKEFAMDGKAEVTGKTLRTATNNPFTGRAESGTQTIVTLTETEFVTEDGKGARITMKRVR